MGSSLRTDQALRLRIITMLTATCAIAGLAAATFEAPGDPEHWYALAILSSAVHLVAIAFLGTRLEVLSNSAGEFGFSVLLAVAVAWFEGYRLLGVVPDEIVVNLEAADAVLVIGAALSLGVNGGRLARSVLATARRRYMGYETQIERGLTELEKANEEQQRGLLVRVNEARALVSEQLASTSERLSDVPHHWQSAAQAAYLPYAGIFAGNQGVADVAVEDEMTREMRTCLRAHCRGVRLCAAADRLLMRLASEHPKNEQLARKFVAETAAEAASLPKLAQMALALPLQMRKGSAPISTATDGD